MATVYVTMEPAKEHGWFSPTGFSLTEPDKWVFAYTVDDPEEFIAHMRRYNSLCGSRLSREEYEDLCIANGITPLGDDEFDSYALEYGDFGMSHYHTMAKNRPLAIANTLHQRRWWSVRDDIKAVVNVTDKIMVSCDCGHTVVQDLVMSASMGSSCPDCYDMMSD